MTDVTLPSGRAFALAAVACTFGAAFTVGPLASIPVVHHFGQHAAFIAGAALVVLSLLYVCGCVGFELLLGCGDDGCVRGCWVQLHRDPGARVCGVRQRQVPFNSCQSCIFGPGPERRFLGWT